MKVDMPSTTPAVRRPWTLFIALSDHNPPTLQTDGRTDVTLVSYTQLCM